MVTRIIEGLDLPIDGEPEQTITDGAEASSVAVLGGDYVGLSPALAVAEGDTVGVGQPLFADRRRPDILFTSPASGVVTEINRGARRALLSVVVRCEGGEGLDFPSWPEADLTTLRPDQVRDALLASGLWTALRARPFNKVADPGTAPHSIFVTAIDTNPLAAKPEAVIADDPDAFANGLTVISRLVDGSVFVCQAPRVELPAGRADNLATEEFSGPHPSGLVGTHIHTLDPVGAGNTVWHLNYQDVMAIGRLFATGRLPTGRIVSLAGPMVTKPRLVRTRLGASIGELTRGELADGASRTISGSVLSGRRAEGAEAYLGRYHNQVSVVAEAVEEAAGGWFGAPRDTYSIYRGSKKKAGGRRFPLTTALHGRPTTMVPLGRFERVVPLDILPTQFLRALMVGDTETAEGLGCLELDEEDLALCTFVCPSKIDYGPLLRATLARIEKEG